MHIKIQLLLFSILFFNTVYSSEKRCAIRTLLYPEGSTNLHIAVYENCFEMIARFVKEGANPLEPDVHGTTPLDIANDSQTLYTLLLSPHRKRFIQQAASKGHTRILATVFSLKRLILPHQQMPLSLQGSHLENYNLDRHFAYQTKRNDHIGYLLRLVPSLSSTQPARALLKK